MGYIKTLSDFLQTDPSPLPEKQKKGYLAPLYQCPTCGVYKYSTQIIDVRTLPITEDWACTGCVSGWKRAGRAIDGQAKKPEDRRDWMLRWAMAHGAPVADLQKLSLMSRQDKYRNQ